MGSVTGIIHIQGEIAKILALHSVQFNTKKSSLKEQLLLLELNTLQDLLRVGK